MELKDIEHKIACNEISAAQVFTQIMQHIAIANKEVKEMQERWSDVLNEVREQAYINGKNYEKDRISELLGLST